MAISSESTIAAPGILQKILLRSGIIYAAITIIPFVPAFYQQDFDAGFSVKGYPYRWLDVISQNNPWFFSSQGGKNYLGWVITLLVCLAAGILWALAGRQANKNKNALTPNGVDSRLYIAWIKTAGSHAQLFQNAIVQCQGQPTIAFDQLYISMNEHASFKRQIKLDYLCMIGHLKIAGIEPGQFYFSDVLSLKKVTRRLFSGHPSARIPLSELNELAVALAGFLGPPFSIAVLYQALMDWGNEKQVRINPNFRRY